jgi:hypothetical protein
MAVPRDATGVSRAWAARLVQAGTIVLSSLTALTLLALALTLNGPPAAAPLANGPRTATVRAFYAAVNTLLAGDDGAALTPLVAPAVVVHLPDDRRVMGQAALVGYWRTLGRGASGLHVALETLFGDGDQVAATIDLITPRSLWPDLVADGPAAAPALTDRFRLVQGRIADYWPSLDPGAVPQALPPVAVPLVVGPIQAILARFALPPHATLTDQIGPGPHLLLPRLGALTVVVDGPAQVRQAASPDAGWRPATTPATLTLQPGDALLVAAGVSHTLRNDTPGPVVLVGVLLVPLVALTGPPKPAPLLALYRPNLVDQPIGTSDVTVTGLADGLDRCPAASTMLRVVMLPLAPGQRVVAQPIAGVDLLTSEQGAVLVDRDRAVSADPGASPAVLAAGAGLTGPTGLSGAIVTAGAEPARLLMIALGPSDATCALATPPAAAMVADPRSTPDSK